MQFNIKFPNKLKVTKLATGLPGSIRIGTLLSKIPKEIGLPGLIAREENIIFPIFFIIFTT